MAFDPTKHLIDLKGKKYLEAKWRIAWFRDEHPKGKINTEVYSLDPLVIRASILTAEGEVLATGHGSAQAKPGAVWSGREIEKAETAAISRALAHAGYGTQFSEDDDKNYLADSPVERRQPQPQQPRQVPPPPAPPASNVTQLQQPRETSSRPPEPQKVAVTDLAQIGQQSFGVETGTPVVGALNMKRLFGLAKEAKVVGSEAGFNARIAKLKEEGTIRDASSEDAVIQALRKLAEKASA